MSELSDKTCIHTIKACAKAIKELDKVNSRFNKTTKENDYLYSEARNNLFSIIQSNGYEMDYNTYRVRKEK